MSAKVFRTVSAAFAVLAGLSVAAASAAAFGLTGIGGKIGYHKPEDVDGTLVYSLHAELEQAGSQFHIIPAFAMWDEGGIQDLNPNVDVYYHFGSQTTVTPYVGAGGGLHFYSVELPGGGSDDSMDPSLNLLAGLRVPMDQTHWFLEGRYALTDLGQGSLVIGFTYNLGQ